MSTSSCLVSAPPIVQLHIDGGETSRTPDATTNPTTLPSPPDDEGDTASSNDPGPDNTGKSDANTTPHLATTKGGKAINTGAGNPVVDD